MHPKKAADSLYTSLIRSYEGLVFVGESSENGINTVIVYIDFVDDPKLQLPKDWMGYPVQVRNVRDMLPVSCGL